MNFSDKARRSLMTRRQIAEENERKYNPEGIEDEKRDRFDACERALEGFASGDFGYVYGDNLTRVSTINQY